MVHLPIWLFSVIIMLASVLASLAGLALVRRFVPPKILREHHEVAGFIIAVLGVIYAVLLALVAIVVWEQFEHANAIVTEEANSLSDVYRLAHGLPDGVRVRVRRYARDYAIAVINEEWPLQETGQESPRAQDDIDKLWQTYEEAKVDLKTDASPLYGESIRELSDVTNNRRMRHLAAREGLPGIMWAVLIFGGVCTVVFTYFFMVDTAWAQESMIALLSAEVAFVLILVGSLSYPFTGDVKVQPEAFRAVLEDFHRIEEHEKTLAAIKSGSAFLFEGHLRPGSAPRVVHL